MNTANKMKPGIKEKLTHRTVRRKIFIACVLTPILAWFVVFMFLPIINVFYLSLTNARMAFPTHEFIGLDNYIRMLTRDSIIPVAVWNTVQAVFIIVPSVLVLALLLAAALNSIGDRSRKAFTFIYFLPSVIPMVAISLVWDWLYHPQFGLFNAILTSIGFTPQHFLRSSAQALPSISVVVIWSLFGYYAVILLAAMRNISPSLYEAADIDGASPVAKFFKIVLPLIKPNILFVTIMSTIASFMLFTPVDVLTGGRGTPGTSTLVLMLYIRNVGITDGNTGYASAISILLLAIVLAVSLVQWLLRGESEPKVKRKAKKGGVVHG